MRACCAWQHMVVNYNLGLRRTRFDNKVINAFVSTNGSNWTNLRVLVLYAAEVKVYVTYPSRSRCSSLLRWAATSPACRVAWHTGQRTPPVGGHLPATRPNTYSDTHTVDYPSLVIFCFSKISVLWSTLSSVTSRILLSRIGLRSMPFTISAIQVTHCIGYLQRTHDYHKNNLQPWCNNTIN